MRLAIRKRGRRTPDVHPEFVQLGDDMILSSTRWDGTDRHQVLTVRGGEIVDIQGCRSRQDAERFARRASRR